MTSLLRWFRIPSAIVSAGCDRLLWFPCLWAEGVHCGRAVRCVGRPHVRLGSGGEIWLGDGVQLVSQRRGNPLVHRRCTLIVRGAGARLTIGAGSGLSGAVVYVAERVEIGCRVLVGANCTIVDTDFHPLSPEQRRQHPSRGAVSKPVIIGDDVFIGAGAILLKGTRLGDGCVVGAGAVVAGAFPARSLVAGNPARVIRHLEPEPNPPGQGAVAGPVCEP